MRLQQGFATGEMGVGGQFAQQQSQAAHVRFVPEADTGYSMNSSARSCSSREIVIPSAFAVLRLITSSYLVGA